MRKAYRLACVDSMTSEVKRRERAGPPEWITGLTPRGHRADARLTALTPG